jgi:hypothetical protein
MTNAAVGWEAGDDSFGDAGPRRQATPAKRSAMVGLAATPDSAERQVRMSECSLPCSPRNSGTGLRTARCAPLDETRTDSTSPKRRAQRPATPHAVAAERH